MRASRYSTSRFNISLHHFSSRTCSTNNAPARKHHRPAQKMQTTANWSLDDFNLLAKLDSGQICEVFHAKHKETGADFKLKRYSIGHRKDPRSEQQIKCELATHSSLFSPSVVSSYGSFEDERGDIYVVFQDNGETRKNSRWFAGKVAKGMRSLKKMIMKK